MERIERGCRQHCGDLQNDMDAIRQRLRTRRERHLQDLQREVVRLAEAAASLGVQRMVLFGSAAWGRPGLSSDLDLLIIWDTPLDLLARTVELYRCLKPQVPVDVLAYTPKELEAIQGRSLVRKALQEGRLLYEA